MFFIADAETGKRFGSETITVDPDSTAVRIKVPATLVERFGGYVFVPMSGFAHRGDEWSDRASQNKAVRYDITFNAEKGRWYIDASWGYPPAVEVPLTALRVGRVLGVDLNAGHVTRVFGLSQNYDHTYGLGVLDTTDMSVAYLPAREPQT